MTRLHGTSSRPSVGRHKASVASEGSTSVSGLVILSGTSDDQRDGITADIVTIHGLTGHFMKTWTTEDDISWPRDLLLKMTTALGATRTMTFGYAAGQLGTKLDLDIEDAAWQLIHGLERVRSTSEQRICPLIFVVHSLGGLVLKKALIISNNALSLRHILWSVEGITFLATPHRGSALADVADKILRFAAVGGGPQRFVKALKMRSPELSAIAEEFRQIVNQRRLPVASFYELHAFKAIPCMTSVVVTKDSAVLHIPTEKLFGVERDHRNIAKYEDAHDEVFQQLVGCLSDFMKNGIVSSNARVFIPWDSSSYFKGRRDVLQQLHESFFPHPEQVKGVGPEGVCPHRVAMIYGDGGLGKTETTLKFARENEFRYSFIFFAEATNIQTLRAEIVNLHGSIGLPKSNGRELQDLREFLRQEKSWLFIFDNDNDFLALNYFKLPEVNHGHILLTSQTRDNTTDPTVHKVIQMRPLGVQEARDLLYSRAGVPIAQRADIEDDVTALVGMLGLIPAMVENTAAYMVSFEATVQDCLRMMSHRKSRHTILGYHASSARYKLSAESLFRIRLNSLRQQNPNAYLLLSTMVWLDRTKTTVSFFGRAVEKRLRWATNGEGELTPPQGSFVPDDIIDLVSSPGFDIAMTNLGSIILHPSLYQFVRDFEAQDDIIKVISPALTLLAQAHPVLEAGLEKSIPLRRQMTYQVQQCLRNIEKLGKDHTDLVKSFRGFWGLRTDLKLITLVEMLIKGSNSVFLHARLWAKRLPLEYYKLGKLYDGCAAAERFLNNLDTRSDRQGWTNRDNAEVGILRALTVEYHLPEPGLSPRERWQKRADYIGAWKPLDPETPSTLERYVLGLGVRMRGKLAKDFGQFKEAYFDLKEFCELVLETENTADGPAIFADLAKKGTNFGEKVPLAEGMRPCELVAYVLSRAVDSRMFERGYLTPEARHNARESDTMWLEMIHAMTLVHQGKHAPERYASAEKELLGLSERFRRIEAVESWYDEQIRHFAVLCNLAQVSHMQHNWKEAQNRWKAAIEYGKLKVSDWKGENYYIEVAKYSLADAECSGGMDGRDIIPALRDTIAAVNGKRVKWMLGMGTFWLYYVHERMVPRVEGDLR
ncbi:hypothetical protein GE09DRAFT_1205853 [Coniochaeta sp. 2T2.1]|nr:hypothetical protein GE09DRAFT_1205853 [Coniochaeta sp. 2T2.1]